jgi:hypothetical protein
MITMKDCPYCQGTGVRMIESSALFGLRRKATPVTCDNCNGKGRIVETPICDFCEGQGLVGNEREICRACNGTGHCESFGFIPKVKLRPGTLFERRCDKCGEHTFEIISEIEHQKLTKTWEREEELRQVEYIDRIKVRCISCSQNYFIPVSASWHHELSTEDVGKLEDLGINLSFMYQKVRGIGGREEGVRE